MGWGTWWSEERERRVTCSGRGEEGRSNPSRVELSCSDTNDDGAGKKLTMAALASIHRNCAQQLVPSTSTSPSFLRLALSSNPSLSPSPSLAHSLLRSAAAHTGLLPAARTSLAAPSLLRTSFAFQLPSLASLFPDSLASLRELLPPWVLAVPKSKTSHSKKAMRSSNKGLKEQQGQSLFTSSQSCKY